MKRSPFGRTCAMDLASRNSSCDSIVMDDVLVGKEEKYGLVCLD
jgi:hypothetical protein